MSVVSIIIPCYRQGRFLPEAIESGLAQDFHGRVEIIVVDDGSPERNDDIVDRYPTVRYIRQTNQGVSAARNRGLVEASGDHLIFLDGDDRLLPGAISKGMVALAASPDAAAAWGLCTFIDEDGVAIRHQEPPVVGERPYRELFKDSFIWSPGAVLFRRGTLEEFGAFDEDLTQGCEDLDLYLRIAKHRAFAACKERVLEYRKHRTNMSLDLSKMIASSHSLYLKHRDEVRGDEELEEVCRRNIQPRWYLWLISLPVIRSPLTFRIIGKIAIRTRIRTLIPGMRASSPEA